MLIYVLIIIIKYLIEDMEGGGLIDGTNSTYQTVHPKAVA
jgi:hypothetical protein